MMLPLLVQLLAAPLASPDPPVRLPFGAGEVLSYDARVSVLGRIGEATLRVDRTCEVAGRPALRLSFALSGGAAFLRVRDDTRSWIDAATLSTLRYEKRETSPLGSHSESVTVLPGAQRWVDAAGAVFETAGGASVDELSLLYFIRTLPLETGDTELGVGHFDPRRNPIELRVRGRTEVDVPAGRFSVIDLELKVRDPRRYRGTGTIRVQVTDDERRIPVRIHTALPGSTAVTLELRSERMSPPPERTDCDEGIS